MAHTKIAELGLRGVRMAHIWLDPLLAEQERASAVMTTIWPMGDVMAIACCLRVSAV